VAAASAKMIVEQQQGQYVVARKRLAALWGSTEPLFSEAMGDLDQVLDIPALADAASQLEKNPLLARRDSELSRHEAKLAVEKSKRYSDLTLRAGIRQYGDTDDSAAVMDLSVPLPFFNRNQGGIAEAEAQIEKTRDLHNATKVQLNISLAIAYEQMENAKIQIATYRESVLPQVEKAYRLTQEGYENGHFGYFEVLDALRTLSESRQQYLEALVRYHKAVAEIESLTAQALPSTSHLKE
jgi:cobalt-zinc-cadmium efflux system outer membrane protein